MKSVLSIGVVTLLNVNFNFLPTGTLMLAMAAAIVLDFITGVIKASFNNDARTSEGYRKTIVKFMQYGGAVCVSMLMRYMIGLKDENAVQQFAPYMEYLNDGLLIFIIFIEVTSVLENMYAIDNRSVFAMYFIKPLLSIMTFAIKNNSFSKAVKAKADEDQNNS